MLIGKKKEEEEEDEEEEKDNNKLKEPHYLIQDLL